MFNLHGTKYEDAYRRLFERLSKKYDSDIAMKLINVYSPFHIISSISAKNVEQKEVKIYKEPKAVIERINRKMQRDNNIKNYLGKIWDYNSYSVNPDIYSEYSIKIKMNYSYFTRMVCLLNSYFSDIDFHDSVLNELTSRFLDHHLEVLDSELAMTILKWYFEKIFNSNSWMRDIFKLMKLACKFGVTKQRFCEHFLVPDFFKNFNRLYYSTKTLDHEESFYYVLYSESQNRAVKINVFKSDFKNMLLYSIS